MLSTLSCLASLLFSRNPRAFLASDLASERPHSVFALHFCNTLCMALFKHIGRGDHLGVPEFDDTRNKMPFCCVALPQLMDSARSSIWKEGERAEIARKI